MPVEEELESLPFSERIDRVRKSLEWVDRPDDHKIDRATLEHSLELATQFLIANQRTEGNFNYEYDFVQKSMNDDDNQVRQAGALWGVASIHRYKPSPKTAGAVKKGVEFFERHTKSRKDAMDIAYPGEIMCKTGTVALTALALIEALRVRESFPGEDIEKFERLLDGYLAHLLRMQRGDGRFAQASLVLNGKPSIGTSPYFDGESLLALAKAARYLGRVELVPAIEKAASAMARFYTFDAWEKDADSEKTKGFYQWGSMAFREYGEAGWANAKDYKNTAVVLAWWMIHTHRTLSRRANTGYAYEGIASAYAIARRMHLADAIDEIAYTIDRGLYKLTAWQVEGPLVRKNRFLMKHRTDDALAIGGVMNAKNLAPLRIDVTQHQSHALILALEEVYSEHEAPIAEPAE
ncbi:hypothetical protein K8I61_19030 [bacterium]|nr:hypothetical protein [bacterium]